MKSAVSGASGISAVSVAPGDSAVSGRSRKWRVRLGIAVRLIAAGVLAFVAGLL